MFKPVLRFNLNQQIAMIKSPSVSLKKIIEQALLTVAYYQSIKNRNPLGQDGLGNAIFFILIANKINFPYKK